MASAFQPQDYLPKQTYERLNQACRDNQATRLVDWFSAPQASLFTAKPEGHYASFLSYQGKEWGVQMHWGTDEAAKVNSLFLVLFSEDSFEVHVYDDNHASQLEYPKVGDKIDFTLAKFSEKNVDVKFPVDKWNAFVQEALEQNLLAGTRCDLKLGEDLKARTFGVAPPTPPKPDSKEESGWTGTALKALLGVGVLFIAYRIYRAFQTQTPTQPIPR